LRSFRCSAGSDNREAPFFCTCWLSSSSLKFVNDPRSRLFLKLRDFSSSCLAARRALFENFCSYHLRVSFKRWAFLKVFFSCCHPVHGTLPTHTRPTPPWDCTAPTLYSFPCNPDFVPLFPIADRLRFPQNSPLSFAKLRPRLFFPDYRGTPLLLGKMRSV